MFSRDPEEVKQSDAVTVTPTDLVANYDAMEDYKRLKLVTTHA